MSLREQAARIIALPDAAVRAAALDGIEDTGARSIVRFYVDDYFARRLGTALPDLGRASCKQETGNE